jgi:hypothetical protein
VLVLCVSEPNPKLSVGSKCRGLVVEFLTSFIRVPPAYYLLRQRTTGWIGCGQRKNATFRALMEGSEKRSRHASGW